MVSENLVDLVIKDICDECLHYCHVPLPMNCKISKQNYRDIIKNMCKFYGKQVTEDDS